MGCVWLQDLLHQRMVLAGLSHCCCMSLCLLFQSKYNRIVYHLLLSCIFYFREKLMQMQFDFTYSFGVSIFANNSFYLLKLQNYHRSPWSAWRLTYWVTPSSEPSNPWGPWGLWGRFVPCPDLREWGQVHDFSFIRPIEVWKCSEIYRNRNPGVDLDANEQSRCDWSEEWLKGEPVRFWMIPDSGIRNLYRV